MDLLQIDQWGENAKWKIDLVLLDSPQAQAPPAQQQQPQQPSSSLHPLLSPQHLHPNAITTPLNNESTSYALPVTSTVQYPVSFLMSSLTEKLYFNIGSLQWDFTAPSTNKDEWEQDVDNLELKVYISNRSIPLKKTGINV